MADPDVHVHNFRTFSGLTEEMAWEQTARLETMVEKMLVDPQSRGIMVVHRDISIDTTFDEFAEMVMPEMTLDPRVPFGNIFHFPSRDAVHAWEERGCPTEFE